MDLPVVGQRVERHHLDIKADYTGTELQQRLEIAKDMAAFANASGGTILIGAYEANDGTLARYANLLPSRVVTLIRAADLAARDHLRPHPVVNAYATMSPEANADDIVVLEVLALPGQPIGVRVPVDKSHHGNAEAAYRFPVRVGTRTVYYEPHQLALIMDVTYRRKVQLLEMIPASDRRELLVAGSNEEWVSMELDLLDPMRNLLRLKLSAGPQIYIPLDAVRHVYPMTDERGLDRWIIQVAGRLTDRGYVVTPD